MNTRLRRNLAEIVFIVGAIGMVSMQVRRRRRPRPRPATGLPVGAEDPEAVAALAADLAAPVDFPVRVLRKLRCGLK